MTSLALAVYLCQADTTKNTAEMSKFIHEEMKADVSLTLQKIETTLRLNNCSTYLIARQDLNLYGKNMQAIVPHDSEAKTYYLFLSKDEQEIQQVIEYESPAYSYDKSYLANFKKLKDTGFLTSKEDLSLSPQRREGCIETASKIDPKLRVMFSGKSLAKPLSMFRQFLKLSQNSSTNPK